MNAITHNAVLRAARLEGCTCEPDIRGPSRAERRRNGWNDDDVFHHIVVLHDDHCPLSDVGQGRVVPILPRGTFST